MSVKQLSVNIEMNLDDILKAMTEDLVVDDIVVFVDELIERFDDDNSDLTHELYELMKIKHDVFLEKAGITEDEYQEHHANPIYYTSTEEPWTTDEGDDEDGDVDVFSTD